MPEPSPSPPEKPAIRGLFRAVGPAIIIASIVLGPGSILASSRVGAEHAYSMLWVLLLASVLMVGMVALSARLGILLPGTLCDEIAERLGRPVAAAIGIVIFLIVASFQTSNNFGVLAAIESFTARAGGEEQETAGKLKPALILIGLNGFIIAVLYGFKRLYRPIEILMMTLVLIMIVGFAGNLFFASPDWPKVLRGMIPSLSSLREAGDDARTSAFAILALVGTTFSVAGAFYQSYLVKEKGWTRQNLRQGLVDSVAGIAVLGGISMIIMITSAAVFSNQADPPELGSAADIALQLEPLFGSSARLLFAIGLFAGAFSSFLMNAVIGGHILADSLGLSKSLDGKWSKALTVLALLLAMAIALVVTLGDFKIVNLILFAQALTVLGMPALAATLVYLATITTRRQSGAIPLWIRILAWAGLVVALVMAVKTGWTVADKIGWL